MLISNRPMRHADTTLSRSGRSRQAWTPPALALVASVTIALTAAVSPAAAEEGAMPDAATIMDRYVEATGGKEAYDKIQNRVVQGLFEMADQGISGDLTIYAARPNRLYSVIQADALGTIERGTDGEVVWEKSDMAGPIIKDGQEKLDMLRDASFDRLVNWRQVYSRTETVGRETVDDRDCDKVEVTPAEGPSQFMYYERESGLLLRVDATLETQMGTITVESYMGDYQATDDILIPREVRIKVMGQERRLITRSVEHNVELPADRFNLPSDVQALFDQQSAEAAAAEKP